ncbi:MAG: hypothetical protein LBT29_06610 [Flavobacteriaceae bacterium]|jgi:hypothetical protein|nr:hypothetical protein [Flavobacteriaceae bacterium]
MKLFFITFSIFALAGITEAQVKDSLLRGQTPVYQNKNDACLNFSGGTFRNVSDNNNLSSIIIRKGNNQVEITDGERVYKTIRWVDDCSYNLFFDKKDTRKDPLLKKFNKNRGLFVTPTQVIDNTLYYKSQYFDGKKNVIISGKLVKLSSSTDFNQPASNFETK